MQLGDLYTHVLQLPVKGLYFFQKVHADFPNYEKAPVALFYQGFILENHMRQQDQAKAGESFNRLPSTRIIRNSKVVNTAFGYSLRRFDKNF